MDFEGNGDKFSRRQSRTWRQLAVFLLLTSGLPGALRAAGDPPLILTQVPVAVAGPREANAGHLVAPGFFDTARIVMVEPGGGVRPLSSGFSAACDPHVHHDGKRVLFAGRKSDGDPWSIWELHLDEGQPRRVVSPGHACRNPVYLSSLFTLDSPEPWYTIAYVGRDRTLDELGRGLSTSLYSVKLDGSELRRISFNPNSEVSPFQMPDGRLIFSGWRRPAGSAHDRGQMSLFGMNIDGTELELYGATQGKRLQHMGCATGDGWVVFVESGKAPPDGAGQLGAILAQRPHHSYRPLTEDPDFLYLYPADYGGQELLVSRRSASGPANSGVFLYHLRTGQLKPVFDSPDHHDLQAKVVRPRPQPDGRSTVVNPEFDTGLLYALNCYDADPRLRPHLAPGTIKRVRVIEGLPARPNQPARSQASLGRRILGEAPVGQDGSFNVKIPSEIPVQLQALDEDGLALATCGWIWVMQKENRGCIGCHEDPELVPENSFVEAVRRSSHELTPPPDQRRGIGFEEKILPILRKHCATADCHGGRETPLNLTGSPVQIHEILLGRKSSGNPGPKQYVHPGNARSSPLIWQLMGKNTSRPWDRRDPSLRDFKISKMPPADHGAILNEQDRQTVLSWIDLGAARNPGGSSTGTAEPMPDPKKK